MCVLFIKCVCVCMYDYIDMYLLSLHSFVQKRGGTCGPGTGADHPSGCRHHLATARFHFYTRGRKIKIPTFSFADNCTAKNINFLHGNLCFGALLYQNQFAIGC